MILRLNGFYGMVDTRMNARIENWVTGKRVLDIGCGFGQLVDYLRLRGYESVGVDLLKGFIEAGKQHYPSADLRISDGELDFPDKSIDTIILKDTIHHLLSETNIHSFFSNLTRICSQRVIIMDPNPTPILLSARRLIHHIDPVCSLVDARNLLERHGFRIVHLGYTDVIAFPLSGGFVSKPLINNNYLGRIILKFDDYIEKVSSVFRVDKLLCWRYLLVGDIK